MPIDYIPADSRGLTQLEWLTSYHSFSFGEYYDPARMGFGKLRVLNDDTVAGGGGFPLHPHEEMEIVTLVLEGGLEHKDSLGSHGVIKAGQMQRMSAGSGIRHSEFNASKTEAVHFLQIWVIPREQGLTPGYEQKQFAPLKSNHWQLIVAPEKHSDALFIHQDVRFFLAQMTSGTTLSHPIPQNKGVYCFLINGEAQVNGQLLHQRDAVIITDSNEVQLSAQQPSLCLLIETN